MPLNLFHKFFVRGDSDFSYCEQREKGEFIGRILTRVSEIL